MRGVAVKPDLVRQLRRSRAWTQEMLAAASHCTVRTIQSAERGKPVDAGTLKRIADAFEIGTATLCAQPKAQATADRNLQTVLDWHQAFTDQDVARLVDLHDRNSVIELPEVQDLRGGGAFEGLEDHMSHYEEVMQTFPVIKVLRFHQYAVGDWVYAHPVAVVRSLIGNVEFTLPHVNVLRLHEGKIIYRTTYANFSAYRDTLPTDLSNEQAG